MIRDPSDGSVKPSTVDEIERLHRQAMECVGMSTKSEREFLFEYRFDGETYGLPVVARSIEEARRKVSAMSGAIYQGEVYARFSLRSWWKSPPTERDWIVVCCAFVVAFAVILLWMPRP